MLDLGRVFTGGKKDSRAAGTALQLRANLRPADTCWREDKKAKVATRWLMVEVFILLQLSFTASLGLTENDLTKMG
jgi:hypothetical protein